MHLRKLKAKDAEYMLEWMHDGSVVEFMDADFSSKSLADCLTFIESAKDDSDNLHLAIANEDDEYQGTVSLKNIKDDNAEFAITIRKSAMGTGVSGDAMREIINIGLSERNLNLIYWYVSTENERAIRFYEKNGYEKADIRQMPVADDFNKDNDKEYIWFKVSKPEI